MPSIIQSHENAIRFVNSDSLQRYRPFVNQFVSFFQKNDQKNFPFRKIKKSANVCM